MNKMEKLQELSKPLVEFLNENFNPHTRIEISNSQIKVVEDVVGIPNK